ncbi:MAG: hypothetical protein JWN98_851 [Abditibacteriota bacterium]|nr:hypothetical protein [Abditibacteriota bacterium]
MNRIARTRAAFHFLAASATAIFFVSGCASRQSQEVAERALQSEANTAKESAGELTDIAFRDWELSGQDEKRRPLWKISARETRIGEGDKLAPRRATLLGARAELFRDGKVESHFEAARIEFISTRQGLRLQMSNGVKMRSVVSSKQVAGSGAPGSGPVEVTMPRADVNVQSRRLFAPDGASVQQGKGARLVQLSARQLKADTGLAVTSITGLKAVSRGATTQAQSATWNWKSGRIEARGEVNATHENTLLRGDLLRADTQVATGVLSGRVRAQSKDSGGEGRATAGAVHFNWQNGSLSARDGVLLERDGGTLRAGRIDTDLKLRGAVASSGVELRKDGATLTADRVQAFDRMTRAVASGRVSLRRQNATLTATRVEAFDGLTRAVASGDVSLQRENTRVRAGRVEAFNMGDQNTLRVLASDGVRLSQAQLQVSASRVEASGLADQSTLRVVATGGANASNGQGSVQAGRVTWQNHRVVAGDGVSLRKDGSTLSGTRLEADDRFQNATLEGDVRGAFADGGTVRAKTLRKRGAKITASGGIVAQRDRLTLRAGTLQSTLNLQHVELTDAVELRTADGAIVRAPVLRYEKQPDKAYGPRGGSFVDASRGLRGRGKTIIVNHVSDPKRREAIITQVESSGNEKALGNLKLF